MKNAAPRPGHETVARLDSDSFGESISLQIAEGRCVMVAVRSRYLSNENLPHENPCAQCGKPIAAPEWFENGPHRTSYLWRCHACGYRFEAVAFFDSGEDAIAA
jgi:DNA-directed RNA polymerase subunit RPC12/RpoP